MKMIEDKHPSSADIEKLRNGLRNYNSQYLEKDYRGFRYILKSEEGEIIGGIEGETHWGRVHVENLWVAEEYRKKGIGSRLLSYVEKLGRQRQCVGIDLETFNFQAPKFYEKLGFQKVGTISGYKNGFEKIYFSKEIGKKE